MTNLRWGVVGVVVLGVFISCSGPVPITTCVMSSECGEGLGCVDGKCEAVTEPSCTDGDTRPCGPEPVGACKKGTQRCVNGEFETACAGQVRPTDESCNSIDDDCDGTVDEDVTQTFYFDRDRDGHGAAADSVTGCTAPTGTVTSSDDCDDTKADVHPGADEVCTSAAVDEDCDGTIDEGCGCPTVGMTMACCSGRGTQTCEARDGGAMYSMCSVAPTTESCNGVDDDCDGQTDESLSFVVDGGFTLADGGAVGSDGTCASGVGACRRTAAAACTMGAVRCAVTEGTPVTEVCNAIDDDCDGQTDEGTTVTCYEDQDGDGVASGTGPSEQCPDSSRPTFGNCPAGYVATAPSTPDCAPMDATKFQMVATRLDADNDTFCVGAPTDECIGAAADAGRRIAASCGSGDDCNDGSATVNSTRVTCYPDEDNDGVASSTTSSSECQDTTRPTFGNCPAGTVAALPTAVDCAQSDPMRFQTVITRSDADRDGHCAQGPMFECIGTTPPPGRLLNSQCVANDDCDDANATINIWVNVRADADQDGFCVGPSITRCSESLIPPSAGVRNILTCNATDDCNDGAGTLNTNKVVRIDNDGDNYCINAAFTRCSETVLAPGFKLASACTQNDCNDNNSSFFRSVDLRSDADNDAWCSGATVNYCLGATNPAGMREVSSCQGNDCKDNNPNATGTCSFTGYFTTEGTKQCGIGPPPTENKTVTPSTSCPVGFSLSTFGPEFTGGDPVGSCTATNPTTLQMTCNNAALGTFRCRISGTCVAN